MSCDNEYKQTSIIWLIVAIIIVLGVAIYDYAKR